MRQVKKKYKGVGDLKITKSQLCEMLGVGHRSVDSYIEEGSIPKPNYPEYPETEMFFYKKDIAEILGMKDFPNEPLIDADEAKIILGIRESYLHNLSRRGEVPCYRIKNARGHKFLYLKSELEAMMKFHVEFWDLNFIKMMCSNIFLRGIFTELMTPEIMKDLSDSEKEVMTGIIINNKSIDEVAKHLSFRSDYVYKIFRNAAKRMLYKVKLFKSNVASIDSIIRKNAELEIENVALRRLAEINNGQLRTNSLDLDKMKIRICDLGVSKRLKNICNRSDIILLGDLIKFSKEDLSKFRNMGKNTVDEISDTLTRFGLKLSTDSIYAKK